MTLTSETADQTGRPSQDLSRWDRGFQVVVNWMPYLTLVISVVLVLFDQRKAGRTGTLVLAAVTAAWVYFGFTRAKPLRRQQRWPMAVYFVGLLVLAGLLMARNPTFFIFVITGFFHAYLIRPWPVTFLAILATSIIINRLLAGFPSPSVESLATYAIVVTIQTLAIGFGTIGAEKLAELSEQRRKALAELEASAAENLGLHVQLVTQAREAGILDERQRMAREIHDTIAQGLTGVITQLEAAGNVQDPSELRRHLDNASRLARESLTEARRSVQGMRPVPLETTRLPDAIADVAVRWSGINEVPVQLTTTGTVQRLHPEIEVVLLRVVQEALANVARHARASRVGVTLSYMGDVVTLDVRDDGIGFEPRNGNGARSHDGFGLMAMRQRVDQVSGHFEVESEAGEGTAISVSVPAVPNESDHD
jgi:signal transduction histidine kinase